MSRTCTYTFCIARWPLLCVRCAAGAVVAYWDALLIVVGPQKDWVKYSYDGPLHLVAEMDGTRIIGQYTHELLQRVPGKTLLQSCFLP